MRYHPAVLMVYVWLGAFAALFCLPFQLESRTLTLYGFGVLLLFIMVFAAGSLFAGQPMPQRPRRADILPDFTWTDRILKAVSLIALAFLFVELSRRNFLDLAASYAERSTRADDLLYGRESESSVAFQVSFVLYPASFIYLVRTIGFERRINLLDMLLYGALPSILASVVMGGRSPLLYALIASFLALGVRRQNFPRPALRKSRRNWPLIFAVVLVGLIAMNYFAQIFIVRTDASGGVEGAFDNAALNWGVSFDGRLGPALRAVLGEGNTYLLFIFVWYLVQGIIISNEIFTSYVGPPHYGIYGFDLATAVMRRINGDFVGSHLLALLDMNIIGFLPSAFGSLFVDFKFFGLVFTAVWGWVTGVVYRKIKFGIDPRWLLAAPFVAMGIFFSLINTPLGFSNGLVTHFWLVVAFLAARLVKRAPMTTMMAAASDAHTTRRPILA